MLIGCCLATVGLSLALSAVSIDALNITGKVVGFAGEPIQGAAVSLAVDGASTSTDVNGVFVLSSEAGVTRNGNRHAPVAVAFSGPRIRLNSFGREEALIRVFASNGRQIQRKRLSLEGIRPVTYDVFTGQALAQGVYYCRVTFLGHELMNRMIVMGGGVQWERSASRLGTDSGRGLGKSGAVIDTLVASRSGYRPARALVTSEAMRDVVMKLYTEEFSVPSFVSVTETTMTFPVLFTPLTMARNGGDGIYGAEGIGWLPYSDDSMDPIYRVDTRTAKVIVLDNGILRVTICPEMGMRVIRVFNLIEGKDLFQIRDTIQGVHVWDAGGVEPSWPVFEHGMHILNQEDLRRFQGGGYRIVGEPDGSVTVAMNLQFSRFQHKADGHMHGRYSDRPLSTRVRLAPGCSRLTVSYRADNPNPTRRSDRIWNDAFFVKGTDSARIIVPARWAVHHFCNEVYDLAAEFNGKPQVDWYDETGYRKRSIFVLNDRYPFAGVYYPAEDVNRVRTHDPEAAPGMKVYIQAALDFIEFWGSTGYVFEEPGGFVDAYHPARFSNSYYLTPDIGALSYANDHVAIGVDTVARVFKLAATEVYEVVVEDFGGNELAAGRIGPTFPVLSGSCPGNEIVVRTQGGTELMRQAFPLELPDNLHPLYDTLYASCVRSHTGGRVLEPDRLGTVRDSRRGFNYELEGLQNNTDGLRDYMGLSAAGDVTSGDDPAYIMSLARVCHRYRCFDEALRLCDLVAGTEVASEADYLRGIIAWESGREPVSFGDAGAEANYHRALLALGTGDTATAVSLLEGYVAAYPGGYRPALALAYLKRDLGAARALAARNPGSLEAVWVLGELGEPGADTDLATLVTNNPGAQDAIERFRSEVTTGTWARVPVWQPFPSTGCGSPDGLR